jgi:hypothetical protein
LLNKFVITSYYHEFFDQVPWIGYDCASLTVPLVYTVFEPFSGISKGYCVKTCAVDQVELGMALLRPARLTPADFKALIRQRGWQMADAAARWAIQPETLSRVAADPERETRWDDLVRALPALTRRERAAATAARLQLYPRRPRVAKVLPVAPASKERPPSTPTLPPFAWTDDEEEDFSAYETSGNGFRYQGYVGIASELVVVMAIGSFAPEGATLLVIDTRLGMHPDAGAQEEYLCESAHGITLWLEPDQMDDWVVSTGKIRRSV